MNDFEFYSPTRFVFGRGVTDAVGQHIAELGYKRALLVYGGGSVVRTGTLARVKESLERRASNSSSFRVCVLTPKWPLCVRALL